MAESLNDNLVVELVISVRVVAPDGRYRQLYCLSGYTFIDKDGKTALKLDRILPNGTVESAEGEAIQLHEKEL